MYGEVCYGVAYIDGEGGASLHGALHAQLCRECQWSLATQLHGIALTCARAGREHKTDIDPIFVNSSWFGVGEDVCVFLIEENQSCDLYIGLIHEHSSNQGLGIRANKVATLEGFTNVKFRNMLVVAMHRLADLADNQNEFTISFESDDFHFLVAEIEEDPTVPRALPIGQLS